MTATIAQIISYLSLVWLTVPSVMFWMGRMELATVKWHMLLASVVWFVATPLWMGRKSLHENSADKPGA